MVTHIVHYKYSFYGKTGIYFDNIWKKHNIFISDLNLTKVYYQQRKK